MIKVYVQELSTYNNAIGVGKWIDVDEFDTKVEELFCEATIILKEHGYHNGYDAEEYEIVDWECEVDINLNSIYHDIKALQELNELLKDSNADEIDKICFLVEEGYTIKSIASDTIDNVYTYENFDVAVEEAKKRDHRKLGKDLQLFHVDEEVGQGLILWTPRGAMIRTLLQNFKNGNSNVNVGSACGS